MSYSRAYNPVLQFIDDAGNPIVSGKLKTFLAGTDTPVATANNPQGTAFNPVEIPLDMMGCAADVWLDDAIVYKFIVYNRNGEEKILRDNVRSEFSVILSIDTALQTLAEAPNTKVGKSDGVTDVKWDNEHAKIRKTVNGNDSDVVEVQSAIGMADLRPINGKAVANEKYVSVKSQSWTYAEKQQARYNIGAIKGGAYLPRGSAVYASLTEISWQGGFGGILSLISGSHTESAHLPPVADVTDRGKALFAKQYDGDTSELVYRFILENCNTNAKVLEALQNGQVPCFKNGTGTFVPYLADVTGVMHLSNVFGVTTQEPFAGDALGKAVHTKVVNGNVVNDCLWGKPYGINLFEYELVKWNDCTFGNSAYQVSDSVEMWRQIPFDRSITIKGITLFSYRDAAYKSFIKGIYRVDGDNASVLSEASDWTISTSRYLHQPKEVLSKGFIIEGSTPEATPIYAFDVTFPPITLEAGNNYLFPCMTAGNNSYSGKGAVMVCYKDASPAMPWETIWTSDENGFPTRGTSTFKQFSYCCRPSLLKVTLSDNTEMWI